MQRTEPRRVSKDAANTIFGAVHGMVLVTVPHLFFSVIWGGSSVYWIVVAALVTLLCAMWAREAFADREKEVKRDE